MRTCNKRSLCWSLFFNKVSGLTPETLLKMLWYVDKYALACPFLSVPTFWVSRHSFSGSCFPLIKFFTTISKNVKNYATLPVTEISSDITKQYCIIVKTFKVLIIVKNSLAKVIFLFKTGQYLAFAEINSRALWSIFRRKDLIEKASWSRPKALNYWTGISQVL